MNVALCLSRYSRSGVTLPARNRAEAAYALESLDPDAAYSDEHDSRQFDSLADNGAPHMRYRPTLRLPSPERIGANDNRTPVHRMIRLMHRCYLPILAGARSSLLSFSLMRSI